MFLLRRDASFLAGQLHHNTNSSAVERLENGAQASGPWLQVYGNATVVCNANPSFKRH